MPIYSMTGFARVQVRVPSSGQDQLGYTLTVKSVNHRFLDVQLRIPSSFDALEMELRRALKDHLVRGHVELTLSIERNTPQSAGYNRDLVAGYISAFSAARDEHALTGQPDLNAILRLPGALQSDNRGASDEDTAALTESVQREIVPLLGQLKIMRAREGESLEAILHASLERLTEAYYSLGIYDEAKTAAAVLGANYPGSPWYQDAYDLLVTHNMKPELHKGSWIERAFESPL